jgi:site-specific DNA recombinase
MTKYVLYARKSSESEERQVKSLDAQETEMLQIAKRESLAIVEIIRESHSAKTTGQRPEFNRMIKGVQSRKYTAILTWAPDRISRNAGDLGVVIDLMDAGKLECVKTYSQTFYNDPYSKFMFMMLGSQAKLENDQKSLNVKRGNREKLKRGDWINGAPFGYLNNIATKTIILDPKRAPYVYKMYEMYSTGLYSFKQISDCLYEQGLRTTSGKKVFKSTIQRIINRTFYYGVMETGGKYYQGNHEAIVSQQLFEKCQELAGNRTRPRSKTKGFTLSGFIKCAKCGCAITAEIKKGKYIYYHCTNGKGICDQKSFNTNENSIHDYIAKDMRKLRIRQKMVDIVYKAKLQELEQTGNFHNHALDTAREALQSLTMRKSRLVDTFTNGDIEEPLYKQKLTVLDNEKVNLEKQIVEIEKSNPDPYSTIELVYNQFKQGYTMAERYKNALPDEKRIILADALSNSSLLDRNIVDLQYKSPYDVFARTPVNASFSDVLAVSG